jgi:ubiquinone/menaquinone biosynthesis C-methylase UbiE
VNACFAAEPGYWCRVYEERTLQGCIYQERRATARQWIDGLALPRDAHVLELGCGAGLTAIDLARRGYRVACLDASEAMVQLAQAQAQQAGVGDRVSVGWGDAHALALPDGSQRLVIALGLLPWLHSPAAALSELARVLEPGGDCVLSTDNLLRLNHLLDPRLTPLLAPARRLAKRALRALGRPVPPQLAFLLTYRALARLLASAGLTPVRRRTLGFGPFTLFGRALLPEALEMRLHHWLQALADRELPLLRSMGAQDLVLARRMPRAPRLQSSADVARRRAYAG